jgi:hypothetical protein
MENQLTMIAASPWSCRRHWISGSLLGGYLPRVDSLRNEGGTVKLSQSHADLNLGLRYRLLPGLDGQLGYRFTYFVQHETSREDDNDIHLFDNALTLGLAYRF